MIIHVTYGHFMDASRVLLWEGGAYRGGIIGIINSDLGTKGGPPPLLTFSSVDLIHQG